MSAHLATERKIGPRGTVARLVVGTAMIATAVFFGLDTRDVLLGFVAFPVVVGAYVLIRGHRAEPVRLIGSTGHCINCGIGAAALIFLPDAALLFYGTSMLLAAVRGYAGCELFAISNSVLRRDDQIACPIFQPVDRAEARSRGLSDHQPQR